MRDTLTGCLERRLEPPERKDQNKINHLHEMAEAEIEISASLEEYKTLFSQEIKSFLIDLHIAVQDAQEEA